MVNDIERTWKLLAAGPCQKLRWTALRDGGETMNGVAYNHQQLEGVARASERGWNCYVLLNHAETTAHRRPHADEINEWRYILVDCDPVNDTLHQKDVDEIHARAEHLLDRLLDVPIIHSGRGIQIWLPIRCPALVWQPAAVSAATRAFLNQLRPPAGAPVKVDLLGDLARIARLPGSINQRTKVRAQFLHCPEDPTRIPAEDIMKYLPSNWAAMSANQVAEKCWDTLESWRTAWSHLTARAQNFLEHGAPAGERHEACWHTVDKLRAFGVSEESARECVEYAAYVLCVPSLESSYVERVFRRVYREGGSHAS